MSVTLPEWLAPFTDQGAKELLDSTAKRLHYKLTFSVPSIRKYRTGERIPTNNARMHCVHVASKELVEPNDLYPFYALMHPKRRKAA